MLARSTPLCKGEHPLCTFLAFLTCYSRLIASKWIVHFNAIFVGRQTYSRHTLMSTPVFAVFFVGSSYPIADHNFKRIDPTHWVRLSSVPGISLCWTPAE